MACNKYLNIYLKNYKNVFTNKYIVCGNLNMIKFNHNLSYVSPLNKDA